MLSLSDLQKYDTHSMYKIYDEWPKIALDAYDSKLEPINFSGMEHIVFAGMGGSGAIGSIFSSILSKTKLHVDVVKGYQLPKSVDENTLVVTTSISGNSVETLTVLEAAKKLNSKIIGFSSGGKMEPFCQKNNIEYRKIPQMHSPRASFSGFLYSMLLVLDPVLPINKQEVLESITMMQKTREMVSSNNLTSSNPALDLANWIDGIPVIYYPYGLQAAAVRFKNSIQENSKIHAMVEDVLEMSHNGIVSWENPSNVKPILIQGKDDHIKSKERWKIIKEYFSENQIDFKEIFSVDGSILSKLINLIYLLDYVTIYHAVLSQTNPSPIKSIDFIKSRL